MLLMSQFEKGSSKIDLIHKQKLRCVEMTGISCEKRNSLWKREIIFFVKQTNIAMFPDTSQI